MAFKVSGTPGVTTPDAYDAALLTALQAKLPALFKTQQPVPVVPAAAYDVLGLGTSTNVYSHIQDTNLTFKPYDSASPVSMHMLPKTIQELFDDFGRLNATLGTELPFTTAQIQTTIPLNFVDPVTEIFNDGETQIWKITHNGVDTHGIHFHLVNVQVINRVGWDGQIYPPDPNELGWKDTVRMNPLSDTIVATRASAVPVPFGVPDSVRYLNPMAPANSTFGFSNLDPLTGNAFVPAVSNVLVNFNWEYTWHCHILGHEENDMMRPVSLVVASTQPTAPTLLTAAFVAGGVALTWTDPTPAIGPTRGTGLSQSIYYCPNIAGGSRPTVTVRFDAAVAFPDVAILEYSGVSTLDQNRGNFGTGTTTSSGTRTTTAANELIFAANIVGTFTTGPGANFTQRIITSPDGDICEDRIVTAIGTYGATAPLNVLGPWVMQMVTFK
jgi:hypothetical protein